MLILTDPNKTVPDLVQAAETKAALAAALERLQALGGARDAAERALSQARSDARRCSAKRRQLAEALAAQQVRPPIGRRRLYSQ